MVLLSKKYVKRWKTNAWNLGLIRRGKERRRNLARSMQTLARSTQQKQKGLESSPFSIAPKSTPPLPKHPEQTETMLPPSSQPQKRQSLPAAMSHGKVHDPETPRSNKRKRVEPDLNDERVTLLRPKHQGHKRSSTVGESIMSAPPHRLSRTPYRSRIDVSQFGDGSLLSESSIKQGRRLTPSTKSDSTRTDYFRLKSLGIDPDTPVVPLTKKRVRTDSEVDETSRTSLHRPASSLTMTAASPSGHSGTRQNKLLASNPQSQNSFKPDDDDEAFFASIRAVRETLADSTSWFQTERETIERSMTPQPSTTPPKKETAAERRLREIRERGHTPSRSEIRLRAMGDKALLPKGFWDGEGMGRSLIGKGKGKGKERLPDHTVARSTGMGFAALGKQMLPSGLANGHGREADTKEDEGKAGASVDDAIEL